MAYDLIVGKTKRDWSCGSILSLPTEAAKRETTVDTFAQLEAPEIGNAVRNEIQKNYNTIVRLDTAKRLPVAVRKEFGGFLKKWLAFGTSHNGKFSGIDTVALNNFREANKRFTERLLVFDRLAKTPLTMPLKQPAPPVALTLFHPPGWQAPTSPRPWGWLLSLGLGLLGLRFLAGKNR